MAMLANNAEERCEMEMGGKFVVVDVESVYEILADDAA